MPPRRAKRGRLLRSGDALAAGADAGTGARTHIGVAVQGTVARRAGHLAARRRTAGLEPALRTLDAGGAAGGRVSPGVDLAAARRIGGDGRSDRSGGRSRQHGGDATVGTRGHSLGGQHGHEAKKGCTAGNGGKPELQHRISPVLFWSKDSFGTIRDERAMILPRRPRRSKARRRRTLGPSVHLATERASGSQALSAAFSPWLGRGAELREQFRSAQPFPLVVIDGFLEDELAD